MTYGGLTLEKYADKSCIISGDTVTYRYVVKNWYKEPVKNLTIVDDHLGKIVYKIELGAGAEKTFYKKAVLTGCTCNKANASAEGPCGDLIFVASNMVCVRLIIINSGVNEDNLTIGRQYAMTSGSDPPVAFNNIEIKKNQKLPSREGYDQYIYREYGFGGSESHRILVRQIRKYDKDRREPGMKINSFLSPG